MRLIKEIHGKLSPKSLVFNFEKKIIFCQNMIYENNISVFDTSYKLIAEISDEIDGSMLPQKYDYVGKYNGGPVELVFTDKGKYAWTTNYQMSGYGFSKPGCDMCFGKEYDKSFVYKIDVERFEILKLIEVGSTPKYISKSDNEDLLFVSNWTSGDLSIISKQSEEVIKTIPIGKHPRGIAYDKKRNLIYIALMAESKILCMNLSNFEIIKSIRVQDGPRHLCIDLKHDLLYISHSFSNSISSMDLKTFKITNKLFSGKSPRTMSINQDASFLYAVCYDSNELLKISIPELSLVDKCNTKVRPVGLTLIEEKGEIWVACYSGCIQVFKDFDLMLNYQNPNLAFYLYSFTSEFYQSLTKKYFQMDTYYKEKNKLSFLYPSNSNMEKNTEKFVEINNEKKSYYIIVASFSSKANAESFVSKSENVEYKLNILKERSSNVYKVFAAKTLFQHESENLKEKIKKKYKDAWIYKHIEK